MNLKEWLVGSFAQIGQILSILYGLFTTFLCCGGAVGTLRFPTPLSLGVDVSHPSPLELTCHPLELVWCVSFSKERYTEIVEAMASQVEWLSWFKVRSC